MRRRYAVRQARACWWDEEPFRPNLTVYEPDDRPQPVGLVDHLGNEIVAVLDRDPIGFVWPRERG